MLSKKIKQIFKITYVELIKSGISKTIVPILVTNVDI